MKSSVNSALNAILLIFLMTFLASCGAGTTTSTTTVKRISVDSSGTEANSASSNPSTSSSGTYTAFQSDASNLVLGDTNGQSDIFLHDRLVGATTRVSVDSSGTQANNGSSNPAISSNGRYVAFQSSASNLVTGDTNGQSDIFVHDTLIGTTTRVSVDSSGTEANGASSKPSISSDGRYVAFQSGATNLVAGDTNLSDDIFVHDTTTGTTTRVSVDSSGTEANSGSNDPSISPDGRYVAFWSFASNLVAGDTNGQFDVFVNDTTTGITIRASVDSSGTEANGASTNPSISSNGRYVAFQSNASNLVAGDTNAQPDIFVHDTTTGATIRASVDSSGTEANSASSNPSISSDGTYVAFQSSATNLVTGDANAYDDIFVHNSFTGTTELLNVNASGAQANSDSANASISSDGTYVAFDSSASNLVAGDTLGFKDIFLVPN